MIGINVTPGSNDGRPQHLSLFRPGEIALLLRPKFPESIDSGPELDGPTQQALRDRFDEIRSPLADDPSELGQGRAYRRPPLTVRRGPGTNSFRVLHTVNLSDWFDAADETASGDAQKTYAAVLGVSVAMAGLSRRFEAGRGQPIEVGNYVIEAATPNWLAGPLQSFCGSPCPGGRPTLPPNSQGNPLRFNRAAVERAVEDLLGGQPAPNVRGNGVTIAVFDAWPLDPPDMASAPAFPSPADAHAFNPLSRIDAFVNAPGYQTNQRLDGFASGAAHPIIPASNIYDYFSVYSTVGENVTTTHACCSGPLQRTYEESSHGLFIADIVNDIAPGADVRLYRVLNNYGTGDAVSLVLAAESVLEEARANPGQNYVLNFSLGVAVILSALQTYIDDPSLAFSDPGAWQNQVAGLGVLRSSPTVQADFEAKNDDLVNDGLAQQVIDPQDGDEYLSFTGMLGKFEYLFSGKLLPENVLVVAASGNDSCAETLFEPRLPAAIEGVLGVTAVDASGAPTPYSNLGDMVKVDEGIGAFGGPVDSSTLDCTGGVQGLFIGEFPPDNSAPAGTAGTPNTIGFAQWSGTSFATAVASAVAACVWEIRPALSGQQMVDQISLIGGPGGTSRSFIKDPNTGSPLIQN